MRFILLIFLLILCIPAVIADDLRPASLNIIVRDASTLDVVWKMPIRNGQRQNLEVILDEQALQLEPKQIQSANGIYTESWAVQRKDGLSRLSIFIQGLKGANGDVLVRLVDHYQNTTTTVLNTETTRYIAPDKLVALSSIDTMWTYMILGIEHILIGLDHLFFVACLVYISGTLRKLLWTITGFTLAHSVTLILAALDIVRVPIAPVESVIALSIVFLAWEIAKKNQQSISYRYPVVVSSSFGLLHGFGFASVLSEIGLPQDEKVTALLSFNIGVEVGQILFVVALFVIYWLISRLVKTISLDTLRFPVSYICGTIATFWMIQRLASF